MNIPRWLLEQRQNMPLDQKVELSQAKIKEWYEHWDGMVYVAFSGGKDSTVLITLAREIYPDIPAVFNDTGLEYPEVREFVATWDNVEWLKPKMDFRSVIQKYGYPVVSKEVAQQIYEVRTTKSEKLRYKRLHGDSNQYKSGKIPERWKYLIDAPFKISHYCCNVLKKYPSAKYERRTGRKPMLGMMADDSPFRRQSYLKYGCQAYNLKRPRSMPMAFWVEDDIWEYIHSRNIPYASIYDNDVGNTGCVFCAFGVQNESEPNKFQKLKQTHPQLHRYCMGRLGMNEILDYMDIPYE